MNRFIYEYEKYIFDDIFDITAQGGTFRMNCDIEL